MHSRRTLTASNLLRHSALGSESLYRILGVSGGLVSVEVVRAPGLERGARVRITPRAARAMAQIRDETATASQACSWPRARTRAPSAGALAG
jgi:hypothetical protein